MEEKAQPYLRVGRKQTSEVEMNGQKSQGTKTSVVIATKNSGATIEKCLSSLMAYYAKGYIDEILVVDAHSTDRTLEIIKKFPVKLLSYTGKSSVWTYYARDIGWRETRGEFVLFTDSDTHLGENFFPAICEFFKDSKIGIVGAQERAVITNRISKTIGEWWLYHASRLKGLLYVNPDSWSWFKRLYRKIAWGGERSITTSGPCYITRRICLEVVNGFVECPEGSGDVLLSRRIIEKGWQATWWLESPLYHHPPVSLKQLVNQRIFYGKLDARIHRKSLRSYQKVILVIENMGSPFIGLILSFCFKNFLHLLIFPLARYAWIVGYIAGLMSKPPKS